MLAMWFIRGVLWNSDKTNFPVSTQATILYNELLNPT